MDKLDEARTELRRLEEIERTLFKQLVEIRAATKTQKSKIDELLKKRPPAINRLPVELLSQILFQSLPTSDEYYGLVCRRIDLSTVSRLWRSVILSSPTFWCDIVVCYGEPRSVASLETQLTRSGNVPLNILVTAVPYAGDELPWLGVLVSSANRWRRLHMPCAMPELLHALEDSKLPSLKDVSINMKEVDAYPRFLLPNQAPALRNLKLDHFRLTPEFVTATTLSTLALSCRSGHGQAINPTFIPLQSLTTLSLTGDTSRWIPLPDSIHLPLLEVLKLAASNCRPAVKAIVAPKLMCFDYSDGWNERYNTHGFGIGSKFSCVQRVTLQFSVTLDGGDEFCQEFCGVRHVNLHANTLRSLFVPKTIFDQSVPADHWTGLESLNVYGLQACWTSDFDFLVRWLTRRLELGWPRLSVRLSGLSQSKPVLGVGLHDMYNKLQTCSNPGMDDVDVRSSVRCSAHNGVFQLNLSGVEPFVADDMFLDCHMPSRCSMKQCVPPCAW